MNKETINAEITRLDAIMDSANAMLDAADGFGDDENIWFNGVLWNVGNLREQADEIIDAHVIDWADAHLAAAPPSMNY